MLKWSQRKQSFCLAASECTPLFILFFFLLFSPFVWLLLVTRGYFCICRGSQNNVAFKVAIMTFHMLTYTVQLLKNGTSIYLVTRSFFKSMEEIVGDQPYYTRKDGAEEVYQHSSRPSICFLVWGWTRGAQPEPYQITSSRLHAMHVPD